MRKTFKRLAAAVAVGVVASLALVSPALAVKTAPWGEGDIRQLTLMNDAGTVDIGTVTLIAINATQHRLEVV